MDAYCGMAVKKLKWLKLKKKKSSKAKRKTTEPSYKRSLALHGVYMILYSKIVTKYMSLFSYFLNYLEDF